MPAARSTPAWRLDLEPFLLGKDVDSLTVQPGKAGTTDALKKVAQAEIGLQTDREAHTRTASMDGVAGLRLIDSDAVSLRSVSLGAGLRRRCRSAKGRTGSSD